MKAIIQKYGIKTCVLVCVGVVLIIGLIMYAYSSGKNSAVTTTEQAAQTSSTGSTANKSGSTAGKTTSTKNVSVSSMCGFTITSPAAGSYVTFPLTVKGTLSAAASAAAGCTWNNVQSHAGNVELFYNLRNQGWTSSGTNVPITVQSTGASTSTLSFSASMNLYTTAIGLTSGSPLKIVFTENPAGVTATHSFTYYLYVR